MKVFAKDGNLGSSATDAGIAVTEMAVTSPVCAVGTVPWTVALSEGTVAIESVPTLMEDGSVR
jgi:hypothetical protein